MAYIRVISTNDMDTYDIRNMVWGGARDRVECLSDDDLNIIINTLSQEYPYGIDETELNDFFWFDDDIYAGWLGFGDAEDLWADSDHQNEEY